MKTAGKNQASAITNDIMDPIVACTRARTSHAVYYERLVRVNWFAFANRMSYETAYGTEAQK
jgi:hypothetical protein